ncbi:MAG: DUF3108 domain-containing protein [Pseudomonadota bacterium]
MQPGQRIFALALAASLALHLLLAGRLPQWWTGTAPAIPFPIEAHLQAPTPTPAPLQSSSAPIPESPAPPLGETTPAPPDPPPPEAPPQEMAGPVPADIHPTQAAPAPQAEPAPVLIPEAPVGPLPRPPQAPLRALPERMTLVYGVKTGGEGFSMGRSIYTWLLRDHRYSLASITEATGITALFVSGRIVQTSEGQVTHTGLRPEQFWMAKGDKRRPPVRLDWNQGSLILPAGSVPLLPLTQDLLSFPFHLAMTVGEEEGEWRLPVTNGKKLREYAFRRLGRETLSGNEPPLDTLHVQGYRDGEGTLDVWLAPSHHWLPVRIRTQDQKGTTLVLELEKIE